VKKLVEGLPFYRDKLHEEGVYARFQEILVKVRLSRRCFILSFAPCLAFLSSYLLPPPVYISKTLKI
jgi:hypothetical protein